MIEFSHSGVVVARRKTKISLSMELVEIVVVPGGVSKTTDWCRRVIKNSGESELVRENLSPSCVLGTGEKCRYMRRGPWASVW